VLCSYQDVSKEKGKHYGAEYKQQAVYRFTDHNSPEDHIAREQDEGIRCKGRFVLVAWPNANLCGERS